MSDRWVQIYLYVLIGVNVLSFLLWAILWLVQSRRPRHPLIKPKHHWRTLFSFVAGLVGWSLFSMRALSNYAVMIATIVMLLIGLYFAELLGRSLKRDANNNAT